MGVSRRVALDRMSSLAKQVEEHLETIAANPDHEARRHWKREVRGFLVKIETLVRHAGKRTGHDGEEKIAEWKARLED